MTYINVDLEFLNLMHVSWQLRSWYVEPNAAANSEDSHLAAAPNQSVSTATTTATVTGVLCARRLQNKTTVCRWDVASWTTDSSMDCQQQYLYDIYIREDESSQVFYDRSLAADRPSFFVLSHRDRSLFLRVLGRRKKIMESTTARSTLGWRPREEL